MTSPPIVDTVANTRTGRYLQNIETPEALADLFHSSDSPPRCIASKSTPDEYLRVRLGFYPLTGEEPVVLVRTVHANALIHTTVMP